MTTPSTSTLVVLPVGLVLGVACVTGVAACSGPSGTRASASGPSVSSATGPVGTGDRGASLGWSTSAEAPVVVLRVAADAVLKEDYGTLAELASSPSVQLVIGGTVVGAAPVYQEQLAFTKLTVQVTSSSNGSVTAGSTVVIYRDGGRIPLRQVLPDLKSDPAAMLPAALPASAVVDFSFMGAEQSVVGDQIVAFLHPDPNPGHAGAYQLVSSVHGLLELDRNTKTYHRLGDERRVGYQTSASSGVVAGLTRPRS